MGIRKWLADRKGDDLPLELSLSTMKVGFLVDYDLKTWEVIGCNTYDYDGETALEWELRSGDDVRFLERSTDEGEVELTFTRRISLRDVEEDVAGTILDEGEPPEIVNLEGIRYVAAESATGVQLKQGGEGAENGEEAEGREFVSWCYESDEGRVLFVAQWGDRDFTAYEGEYVEEYQFVDILPGPS